MSGSVAVMPSGLRAAAGKAVSFQVIRVVACRAAARSACGPAWTEPEPGPVAVETKDLLGLAFLQVLLVQLLGMGDGSAEPA